MKKTTVKILSMLLCFITSCSKNDPLEQSPDPPAAIVIDFIMIDKDSNSYFKVPDVFNSVYNPYKLICKDEKGNLLKKAYIGYKADGKPLVCNLDTLKSGQYFSMMLTDSYIYDHTDSLGRAKYLISFDQKETDTIICSSTLENYFRYNNQVLNRYNGNKFPQYKGYYLIIK